MINTGNNILDAPEYFKGLVIHAAVEKALIRRKVQISKPPNISSNGGSTYDLVAKDKNGIWLIECKFRAKFRVCYYDEDLKEIGLSPREVDTFLHAIPENFPPVPANHKLLIAGELNSKKLYMATADELAQPFTYRGIDYPYESTSKDGIKYRNFSLHQFKVWKDIPQDAVEELNRIISSGQSNIKKEFIPRTISDYTKQKIVDCHLYQQMTIDDDELDELNYIEVEIKRYSNLLAALQRRKHKILENYDDDFKSILRGDHA